jgi:hypothetical protein
VFLRFSSVPPGDVGIVPLSGNGRFFQNPLKFISYPTISIIYCTGMAVLVGNTDSDTQSFTLFISDFTVGITPLSSSNSRTRELSSRRLSNPRTVDSRTLVFFDWLFSSTLAYHLLIAHQSLASLFEVLAHSLTF